MKLRRLPSPAITVDFRYGFCDTDNAYSAPGRLPFCSLDIGLAWRGLLERLCGARPVETAAPSGSARARPHAAPCKPRHVRALKLQFMPPISLYPFLSLSLSLSLTLLACRPAAASSGSLSIFQAG